MLSELWAGMPPENLIITALLPLTALMLVTQTNPYHALVMRGILGAVAALVYAIFGAADVALTEALVGTMLSITLYAVAVRSSMSLRLGHVQDISPSESLTANIRQGLRKQHLRLEMISYPTAEVLQQALSNREIHAIYLHSPLSPALPEEASTQALPSLQLRLVGLYQLLRKELSSELVSLSLVQPQSETLKSHSTLSWEQPS